MSIFRVHLSTGDKHDVEAQSADEARKIVAEKKIGLISKIKRVRS